MLKRGDGGSLRDVWEPYDGRLSRTVLRGGWAEMPGILTLTLTLTLTLSMKRLIL